MAYCTSDDMQTRFEDWELIDLTNPGGNAIDLTKVNQSIEDAGAEIEAYLGGRYTLPLNPVPKVLNRIACNLARYHLYDNKPTEAVEKAYQDGLGFLTSVAKGHIKLGIDVNGQEAIGTSQTAQMTSSAPVWHRKKSSGFI